MNAWPMWIWWAAAAVSAALGLPLLWWAAFGDRSRGRRRCPSCWYDMSGAVTKEGAWLCPECGQRVTRERRLLRTRHRWRWVMVGIILSCAGPIGAVRQQVLREGWLSFLPTWLLIQVARTPWMDGDSELLRELAFDRYSNVKPGGSHARAIATLLLDRLRTHPGESARRAAVMGLAWVGGHDARVTPALLKAMESPETSIRVQSIRSFRIYKADPNQVVDPLVSVACDLRQPPEVRAEAIDVLAHYRDRAASAAPAIIAALEDQDETVHASAAWSVGFLAKNADNAIPILMRQLRPLPARNDHSTAWWKSTATSLAMFDSLPAELAPYVDSLLSQTDIDEFRQPLLWIVCRMGPDAVVARASVQRVVQDPYAHRETVLLAQLALMCMDDRTANPTIELARIVRTPSSGQRVEASRLLWYSPRALDAALPLLLDELDDGMDPLVLRHVCHAIERHTHPSKRIMQALEDLMDRWPDGAVVFTLEQMRRREWRGDSNE